MGVKVEIRNRIREHRERLGMTQAELAKEAGVSRQSVISIERGKYVPSLPLALKFSEIFERPTDDLFRRVEVR
jgi:putative transcriptional regulator